MAIGVDDVEQLDDVGVAHLLQQGDLTDGGTRDTLIFSFKADLLQRYYATAVGKVPGLVDDAVRA